MPAGACVLRYRGTRGTTWSIKYIDASGRQVRERLGKASEGWTRRKAEVVLRARLTDVVRDGYRKPEPITFESFARDWLDTVPEARQHRRTTRADLRPQTSTPTSPRSGGPASPLARSTSTSPGSGRSSIRHVGKGSRRQTR